MKRFALLLITAILSLNCMAQSNNTTTIKLHQGEFINLIPQESNKQMKPCCLTR